MNLDELKKMSKSLSLVLEDIPNDIKNFDGKVFNGKNVAEQFGYLSAQVEAVGKCVKKLIDEKIEESGN